MLRYVLSLLAGFSFLLSAEPAPRRFSERELSDIYLGVGSKSTQELQEYLEQSGLADSASIATKLKDYFKGIVAQSQKIATLRQGFFEKFNCQMAFPFGDTSLRPGVLTYLPTGEGTPHHFMRQMYFISSVFEFERALIVDSFLDQMKVGTVSRDEMREAFTSLRNARDLTLWLWREAPALAPDLAVRLVLDFSERLAESTVSSFFLSELPPDRATKVWPSPASWTSVYFSEDLSLRPEAYRLFNMDDRSELASALQKIHLEFLIARQIRESLDLSNEEKEAIATLFTRIGRAPCETWSLGID